MTTYVIYCPCRKAYWGPNEHGYTEYLSQAGTYSAEQIARIDAEGRLDDDEPIRLPEPRGTAVLEEAGK
jgi:hypothetical protein